MKSLKENSWGKRKDDKGDYKNDPRAVLCKCA